MVIFRSINGGSSRNTLPVVSGRGCTGRSTVSRDYHCCWQLHMHRVSFLSSTCISLEVREKIERNHCGTGRGIREHRPSAVVNEDAI